MSQNLQNFAEFQKNRLDNLVWKILKNAVKRRNACPEYATFCAYSSFAELLPHASPYVAREMSFAVSGALANRGLTTVRLAWGACSAHLPLPVNRSASTDSARVKRISDSISNPTFVMSNAPPRFRLVEVLNLPPERSPSFRPRSDHTEPEA